MQKILKFIKKNRKYRLILLSFLCKVGSDISCKLIGKYFEDNGYHVIYRTYNDTFSIQYCFNNEQVNNSSSVQIIMCANLGLLTEIYSNYIYKKALIEMGH